MTTSSREPYRPLLVTDADVTTMWRTLISPLGWHTHRLYLLLVDPAGRPNPHVIEVDEIPGRLTTQDATQFADLLSNLVHGLDGIDSGSAAIMLARPGSAVLTDGDRSSCRALYEAASAADVRLELIHIGTDTEIVPAPMDEVLPRSA